ncbi:MAG: hypothetical protein Q9166_005941 [cf. Caloplaca sp. 2 TL-2023]
MPSANAATNAVTNAVYLEGQHRAIMLAANLQHRDYEASRKQAVEERDRQAAEAAISENETEVDTDEMEDFMNNLRSPVHRTCCHWTLEYEARRQARKRLWSPPLTPDPAQPHQYSLQPSQRPPSPTPPPMPLQKPSSSPLRPPQAAKSHRRHLEEPRTAQHRVRKNRRLATFRRPTTRSTHSIPVSLHDRKGYVVIGSVKDDGNIASFEEYLGEGLQRG